MAKRKLTSVFYLLAFVVVGTGLALGLFFYLNFYNSDAFLPGVVIASVPVQQLDLYQAQEAYRQWLQDIGDKEVEFYYGNYVYKTTLEDIANLPDAESAVGDVWQQEQNRGLKSKLSNMDGQQQILYPQPIDYDQEKLQTMAEEWEEVLIEPPVEPRLEIDPVKGLVIVKGQEGKGVDLDATLAELPFYWEESSPVRVAIIVEKRQPTITEEELRNVREIASYTTWYNPGETDRTHNLTRAANAINSKTVPANAVFSFNDTVGRRGFDTGYRDAMVIVNGKYEPGVGGGICQVSSTLYNAVLLAGLDIVERHNHALAVSYIPVGLDATVAYGVQDFRFLNNTRNMIYIQSSVGGGKLTITIYGNINNNKEIEVENVIDKVIAFQEIQQLDNDLAAGQTKVIQAGVSGYVSRSYRTFYDAAGSVENKEQLSTDYYRPLDKVVSVGPDTSEGDGVSPESQTAADSDGISPESQTAADGDNVSSEGQSAAGGDGLSIGSEGYILEDNNPVDINPQDNNSGGQVQPLPPEPEGSV